VTSRRHSWEDVDELLRPHVVLRVPLWGRGGVLRGWALVDPDDGPTVLAHRWFLDTGGYAVANVRVDGGARTRPMYRLLIAPPSGLDTDHRNRDKLDNRRINLRAVTHAENMMNVGPTAARARPRCLRLV
jgi:HNH endonuclease